MRAARVVVIGSSNTDMVVKAARIPQPGETVLGGEFVMVPGGKGANQGVAAARLGAEATLEAGLGDDLFAEASLRNFRRAGIRTEAVVGDPEAASGGAMILVDEGG